MDWGKRAVAHETGDSLKTDDEGKWKHKKQRTLAMQMRHGDASMI